MIFGYLLCNGFSLYSWKPKTEFTGIRFCADTREAENSGPIHGFAKAQDHTA
jgi:hypothetical protein